MGKEEFVSTLMEKLSRTVDVTKKKSGELVEITRLKFAIMDTEGEIKKLLSEIGTIVYEARKNDTEIDESLAEKCDRIDALYAEIEESQKRMDVLRSVKVCPSCEKKMPADCEFCPSCGLKVADVEKETETEE